MSEPLPGEPTWALTARRHWRDVIDAWNEADDGEQARAAADLAVEMGLWTHPLQRPADYHPELPALPVHAIESVRLARQVNTTSAQIAQEISDLAANLPDLSSGRRRPVVARLILCAGGRWSAVGLPHTRNAFGGHRPSGNVSVITVGGGGRVGPRCDDNNSLLTVMLPVDLPPGAQLSVAGEPVAWQPGRCLLLDLSFEHEIRHADADADADAMVLLLMDVPHPAMTQEQADVLFGPAARIRNTLRDAGLHQVEMTDGGVILRPGPELGELAGSYLAAVGIEEISIDDEHSGPVIR